MTTVRGMRAPRSSLFPYRWRGRRCRVRSPSVRYPRIGPLAALASGDRSSSGAAATSGRRCSTAPEGRSFSDGTSWGAKCPHLALQQWHARKSRGRHARFRGEAAPRSLYLDSSCAGAPRSCGAVARRSDEASCRWRPRRGTRAATRGALVGIRLSRHLGVLSTAALFSSPHVVFERRRHQAHALWRTEMRFCRRRSPRRADKLVSELAAECARLRSPSSSSQSKSRKRRRRRAVKPQQEFRPPQPRNPRQAPAEAGHLVPGRGTEPLVWPRGI